MAAESTTGQQIRALRKARGMTQADLAEATGLRLETISRLERDENKPTARTRRDLARALRVPERELEAGRAKSYWGRDDSAAK